MKYIDVSEARTVSVIKTISKSRVKTGVQKLAASIRFFTRRAFIAVIMKAVRTSETSAYFNETFTFTAVQ
jgi:hypothetical protein